MISPRRLSEAALLVPAAPALDPNRRLTYDAAVAEFLPDSGGLSPQLLQPLRFAWHQNTRCSDCGGVMALSLKELERMSVEFELPRECVHRIVLRQRLDARAFLEQGFLVLQDLVAQRMRKQLNASDAVAQRIVRAEEEQ